MAAAAVHSPTEAAVAAYIPDMTDTQTDMESPFGGYYTAAQLAHHPKAAFILRQIEFYFSDENLRQDRHLLALTGGDGNGPVRINDLLQFPKMKRVKGAAGKIKDTIKESHHLEVSEDRQYVKRKYPMAQRITVVPQLSEDRPKTTVVPADKPWLTKNMLKPTGFEPNATEGPMSPEQYKQDMEKYDPDQNSILNRLETAVACFNLNRKMHQTTRAIFEGFMRLGGVDTVVHMFTGGVEQERKRLAEDGFSKEEIAQQTSHYGVCTLVKDAFFDEMDGKGKSNWIVDFEGAAKAYLSSVFMDSFDWYDENLVATATNILRNFYHYLSYHSVFVEYTNELRSAHAFCSAAEDELLKLAVVDRNLPGAFNSACSTLYEGAYADVHISKEAQNDWAKGADNMGLSREEAINIFKAGIAAYCSDEQNEKAHAALNGGAGLKVISRETVGLEITAIELPSDETKKMYAMLKREGWEKYIHPMGKIYCKRWTIPAAPPSDLPAHLTKSKAAKTEQLEFLVEEETLNYCMPGMKMEAVVMELDLGIKFIDSIEQMWPSFYTWLPNEAVLDYKEPGDAKAWMVRQQQKKNGGSGEMVKAEDGMPDAVEDGEDDLSDESPD